MKKNLFILFIVFVLFGCSSENDTYVQRNSPLKGSVTLFYKGEKLEYKEIVISRFTYIDQSVSGLKEEVSGTKYCFYTDETHSSSNALFLDVSSDSRLVGMEFYYSFPQSNWSTVYLNYYKRFDDVQTKIDYSFVEDNRMMQGKFKGKLYAGPEVIDIDSCSFYIQKSESYLVEK